MNDALVSISPSLADGLILKVEAEIIKIKENMNLVKPDLDTLERAMEKAHEDYLFYHREYKTLESNLAHEERTLELLAQVKAGKPMRVLKGGSNTLIKAAKPRSTTPWVRWTTEILLEVKTPMWLNDILSTIESRNKGINITKGGYYLKNLAKYDKSLRLDHSGRIGLLEWYGNDGVILPQYLQMTK